MTVKSWSEMIQLRTRDVRRHCGMLAEEIVTRGRAGVTQAQLDEVVTTLRDAEKMLLEAENERRTRV